MPSPKRKPPAASPPRQRRSASASPRRRSRRKPTGWRSRVAGLWLVIKALPRPLLAVMVVSLLAVGALGVNIAHWVMRKPAVLLAPLSGALAKTPAQTWDSYGEQFRRHSTAAVPAEFLATLAQMESAGDPVANTYWRWNPESPDFFGIFRPASSSVGLYQMTDPAFEEARRYCIRDHAAIEAKPGSPHCDSEAEYSRLLPSHAIELTAAWLDRSVAKTLGKRSATPAQMRDVAAIIHLCGGSPAQAFVKNGFRLTAGARCGDHDPAAYLEQVHEMERVFRKLAAR